MNGTAKIDKNTQPAIFAAADCSDKNGNPGDGNINVYDLRRIFAHMNGSNKFPDYK